MVVVRVRYRILQSKRDPAAVRATYRDLRRSERGQLSPFPGRPGFSADLEAPRKIEVTDEGSDTLAGIRQRIAKGTLKAHDLVDVGRGWACVEDCPEFFDTVQARRAQARTRFLLILLVLAGVAASGALLARILGRW